MAFEENIRNRGYGTGVAEWREDVLRVEYVQPFPSALDWECKRNPKKWIGRPDALYAELFTLGNLFFGAGVREINNIAIAVRLLCSQCPEQLHIIAFVSRGLASQGMGIDTYFHDVAIATD